MKMKHLKFILSIIVCLFIVKGSFEQNKQKKVSITAKVYFCNTYCGGMMMTEEIQNKFKKEYVLSYSTIILKKDSSKTEIKVTTDSSGAFKACLAPGKYYYYMTSQYNKKISANFNSDCDIWLSRNFGEVEISPKTKKYKIVYYFGCNPCEPPRP